MIGWKVLRVCPDIGDTIVTNISGLFKNEFFYVKIIPKMNRIE